MPSCVSTDVVVVADASTDRTAAIAAERLGRSGVIAESEDGCVGLARALAAKLALRRHGGSPAHCWLANTDADCVVPSDWLMQQLEAAKAGVAAIAGIVDVDSFEEHLPFVQARFRSTYLIHADGTHPHVHGANLGCRGDAYLRAGGWAPQMTGEDHNLWHRLQEVASRCVADARLQVHTSGRRVGRAPLGFADALAAHNKALP